MIRTTNRRRFWVLAMLTASIGLGGLTGCFVDADRDHGHDRDRDHDRDVQIHVEHHDDDHHDDDHHDRH